MPDDLGFYGQQAGASLLDNAILIAIVILVVVGVFISARRHRR